MLSTPTLQQHEKFANVANKNMGMSWHVSVCVGVVKFKMYWCTTFATKQNSHSWNWQGAQDVKDKGIKDSGGHFKTNES